MSQFEDQLREVERFIRHAIQSDPTIAAGIDAFLKTFPLTVASALAARKVQPIIQKLIRGERISRWESYQLFSAVASITQGLVMNGYLAWRHVDKLQSVMDVMKAKRAATATQPTYQTPPKTANVKTAKPTAIVELDKLFQDFINGAAPGAVKKP